MIKDEIISVLKSLDAELNEDTVSETAEKLVAVHDTAVQPLLNKRDELLGKITKKNSEFSDLQSANEEFKTKLEKFEAIDDPDAAIEALERIKNSPKEQEIEVIIEERTKKLTQSLQDELESNKTSLNKTIEELTNENNGLKSELRDKDFDHKLEKVASKMAVPPHAREDFAFRMQKAFKYSEEHKDYFAYGPDGEPLRDPSNPVDNISFETYAEKMLKKQAPHIFASNINPDMNGNSGRSNDASKYFNARGRPNIEGMKLRDADEKEYNRLKSQIEKKLQQKAQ